MTRNLSPEEKKKWILENCINKDEDIDLSDLDFSDFEGNVLIDGMKVKGDLFQMNQYVEGFLYQGNQRVEGDLYQHGQDVFGEIHEDKLKEE